MLVSQKYQFDNQVFELIVRNITENLKSSEENLKKATDLRTFFELLIHLVRSILSQVDRNAISVNASFGSKKLELTLLRKNFWKSYQIVFEVTESNFSIEFKYIEGE